MLTKPQPFRFLACILSSSFIIFFSSCEKTDLPEDAKQIISCSLKRNDGQAFPDSEIKVVVQDKEIHITVPVGTDRSHLIPEFIINGKTISPASGVAQNFLQPVKYTVTAEDGSTEIYTVTVFLNADWAIAYIGSLDGNFYALDAKTGNLKWKYTSDAGFAYSGASHENGVIYVGGQDSYVYAFNAQTGEVLWRFKAGDTGIESDAVVVNGIVYVGSNDDYLYALDAATGLLKWKFLTHGNVSSSPTVAKGIVYFGSSDNALYALDAETGTYKWSVSTGGRISSGPAISNGMVYVGSQGGQVYAIDAVLGSTRWQFSDNGISFEQSSPTVSNNMVYIGGGYDPSDYSLAGSLYAIDIATGKLIWEKLPKTAINSSPVIGAGRLFITAGGSLHSLDTATGNSIWNRYILDNGASPTVSDKVVYVGGGGTRFIYAFDALTGTEKWRFPIAGGRTNSPLIVKGNGFNDYPGKSGLMN